jgi:hypothetical protein
MLRFATLLPALVLAGCVASSEQAPPAAPPPVLNQAGLEGVMGRNAGALQQMFGTPDLDVREGTARKLQFISVACVLDAYLYPGRSGGDPVVTWVDARMPDGRDFDRASCVAAIIAKKQVR